MTKQQKTSLLLASGEASFGGKGENEKRRLSGIAYTGKPFSYYGDRCIIDLSSLKHKAKVPLLYQHDPDKRLGHCALNVSDKGLEVDGVFLSSPTAAAVVADADEGFSFELSVHAQTDSYEQIPAGQTVEVNGQQYKGPLEVARGTRVREVSLTPVGVDGGTSAKVMAEPVPEKEPENNGDKPDVEKENEALKAQVATLTQQYEALLAEKRQGELNQQLAAAHIDATKLTPELNGFLLSLDADKRQAVIGQLAPSPASEKPAIPGHFLAEQTPAPVEGQQLAATSPLLAEAERQGPKHDFSR